MAKAKLTMGLGFVYKATDQKKLTMRKRSREPNRDGCYKQHGKVMGKSWIIDGAINSTKISMLEVTLVFILKYLNFI